MYRKILIGGVTAAAIIGAGGAALAATGSDSAGANASATHSAHQSGAKAHHKKGRRPLRHLDHAQIVVHTKKGYVTRELIRGTVTDVSSSSITVTSADHATDTFTVTKDTKVATRSNGKRQASSIGSVTKGDHVFVGGIGAGTPVARHILDRGSK